MQCQQLPQSQKSEFIEKMNSLIRDLESKTLMSGEGKREIIYNLRGFMDSDEILNLLKPKYEHLNKELQGNRPFSWVMQTPQDFDKDIEQYLYLISLCIKAEGEYIDKLLDKPSKLAKLFLKYWGVKVPFCQGSPRLKYISDYIVMLNELVEEPTLLQNYVPHPYIIIPYLNYIIKELKGL